MILHRYPIRLNANEAYFGATAGWYVFEVTDCDTVVLTDHDSRYNPIPYRSRADAVRENPEI